MIKGQTIPNCPKLPLQPTPTDQDRIPEKVTIIFISTKLIMHFTEVKNPIYFHIPTYFFTNFSSTPPACRNVSFTRLVSAVSMSTSPLLMCSKSPSKNPNSFFAGFSRMRSSGMALIRSSHSAYRTCAVATKPSEGAKVERTLHQDYRTGFSR